MRLKQILFGSKPLDHIIFLLDHGRNIACMGLTPSSIFFVQPQSKNILLRLRTADQDTFSFEHGRNIFRLSRARSSTVEHSFLDFLVVARSKYVFLELSTNEQFSFLRARSKHILLVSNTVENVFFFSFLHGRNLSCLGLERSTRFFLSENGRNLPCLGRAQ